MGILVIVIVGFIVLTALTSAYEAMSPGNDLVPTVITSFVGSMPFLIAGSMASVLVVYRALPPRAPRWRSAVPPAIVVGLALVVLSQIFTFLVPRLVGVAALAGSLASAFIALAWLSFGFQALLYGAAWVRVRENGIPAGYPWGVPHRRQNRAVAESDSPQLTHGGHGARGLGRGPLGRDFAVRFGPQGVDAALRRRPVD